MGQTLHQRINGLRINFTTDLKTGAKYGSIITVQSPWPLYRRFQIGHFGKNETLTA